MCINRHQDIDTQIQPTFRVLQLSLRYIFFCGGGLYLFFYNNTFLFLYKTVLYQFTKNCIAELQKRAFQYTAVHQVCEKER